MGSLNPVSAKNVRLVEVAVTVVVVDDRGQVRERLARVLREVPGIHRPECMGTDELLGVYPRRRVDVAFVGMRNAVPAGVDTVRTLLELHPEAGVIVFGCPKDTTVIAAAIAAGAAGFLRWDTPEAASTAAAGDPGWGREVGVVLTERELEILTGMSQGVTNSGIARDLFLSEDTIKAHAKLMFRKLGVGDRAAAVLQGFRHNLVR